MAQPQALRPRGQQGLSSQHSTGSRQPFPLLGALSLSVLLLQSMRKRVKQKRQSQQLTHF